VGFGSVTPYTPAGHVSPDSSALSLPFQVSFGSTQANVIYAGMAPQEVGLYQFSVIVPSVPVNAATPLSFTLNGVSGAQTLYIAIGN
jgi:uncharacterized protein (TIGR03437 family)